EFVGQEPLREQLAVAIEAATARGDPLDHLLLAGPPGLGKTSLAQIVAAELEVPFVQTAGPALERTGDIAAFLTALEPRSVFFVDEIHRLASTLEETFYPAMQDHRLPIPVGQVEGAGRMAGGASAQGGQGGRGRGEGGEGGGARRGRELRRAVGGRSDGGRVGRSTLAAAVGAAQHTIEDVSEPYLLMQGLIKGTP